MTKKKISSAKHYVVLVHKYLEWCPFVVFYKGIDWVCSPDPKAYSFKRASELGSKVRTWIEQNFPNTSPNKKPYVRIAEVRIGR